MELQSTTSQLVPPPLAAVRKMSGMRATGPEVCNPARVDSWRIPSVGLMIDMVDILHGVRQETLGSQTSLVGSFSRERIAASLSVLAGNRFPFVNVNLCCRPINPIRA